MPDTRIQQPERGAIRGFRVGQGGRLNGTRQYPFLGHLNHYFHYTI